MSRKLTHKEFDEIARLSRRCIDAYSQKEVENELRRLKFLSSTMDVDTYTKGVLSEVASYSHEASKQKPHQEKDHWVSAALSALGKLETLCTDKEEDKNGR